MSEARTSSTRYVAILTFFAGMLVAGVPLPQVGERMTMPTTNPPIDRHVTERMGMRHTEGGVELDMHE
jgi:hypothetical protein